MNDHVLVYHNDRRVGIADEVLLKGYNDSQFILGFDGRYHPISRHIWEHAILYGNFGNCKKKIIPFSKCKVLSDYIVMLYSK